jgi:hypothetical protein
MNPLDEFVTTMGPNIMRSLETINAQIIELGAQIRAQNARADAIVVELNRTVRVQAVLSRALARTDHHVRHGLWELEERPKYSYW